MVKAESSSYGEGKDQAVRRFPKKDVITFQVLMSSHAGNVLLSERDTHLQSAREKLKVMAV